MNDMYGLIEFLYIDDYDGNDDNDDNNAPNTIFLRYVHKLLSLLLVEVLLPMLLLDNGIDSDDSDKDSNNNITINNFILKIVIMQ
jgi:hypothetical protein